MHLPTKVMMYTKEPILNHCVTDMAFEDTNLRIHSKLIESPKSPGKFQFKNGIQNTSQRVMQDDSARKARGHLSNA